MARTTWLAERGGSVSLQLFVGDDVGLAEQTGRQAPTLDLVAQGGCADAEFGGGFGEGEHGLALRLVRLGHEVGLDLAEPALHRLATTLVGSVANLVGVEPVRVVSGVTQGPLVLGPAIGPLLPSRAHFLEFVAKLGSLVGGDHRFSLLGLRGVLALGEHPVGDRAEALDGLGHVADVAPVEALGPGVVGEVLGHAIGESGRLHEEAVEVRAGGSPDWRAVVGHLVLLACGDPYTRSLSARLQVADRLDPARGWTDA